MVRWVAATWVFCSLRGVRAAEGPRPQAPRPGWPRSSRARTSATLVLAVLAEVVAPIFIAAGLWTRWAAIPVAAGPAGTSSMGVSDSGESATIMAVADPGTDQEARSCC